MYFHDGRIIFMSILFFKILLKRCYFRRMLRGSNCPRGCITLPRYPDGAGRVSGPLLSGVFHLSHPFLVPLLLREVYLFASLGHVGVENVRTTFPEQGKLAPFSWCQPLTFPWFLSPVSPDFSCPPFSTADEKLTLHSFFLEC